MDAFGLHINLVWPSEAEEQSYNALYLAAVCIGGCMSGNLRRVAHPLLEDDFAPKKDSYLHIGKCILANGNICNATVLNFDVVKLHIVYIDSSF